MFKVFDFFQDAIKSCNVFTSPVNLRYKLDPDYNTVAGGFVSIILILLLMSVFFNSWMALLNKTDISSTTEVIREFDPSYMNVDSNNFMFAIGVNGINLSDNSQGKYFDLTMTKVQVTKDDQMQIKETPFLLEPCTVNHWMQLGEDFVQTYKRQELNSFLCPPKNQSIEVIGKWTSQKFTYIKISFDKCKGPNCKTKTQMDSWIAAHTSFFFNFFYSNTLLNPDQTQPISMFLEDKDFTMFSPTLGTFTNIYLGEYAMETDESIFPWFQKKVENGFIVNRAEKQTLNFVPSSSDASYCQLFLRKSNIKLQIQRKFRKLDDMLSYIGGLFGIIAVAIGFVMNYYGQCSFELEMCQKIFDYQNQRHGKQSVSSDSQTDKSIVPNLKANQDCENNNSTQFIGDRTQKVIEPKDFGFLDFFLHILVYIPLKKICNLKWRRMKIYEESLEEMRQKLDIGQLMEKLTFYDRSLNVLFDQNQLKLLYLQEKFNFQEVRDERNMLGLRQGILTNLINSNNTNLSDSSEVSSIHEYKKSLNEIAKRNSKKIHTFLGGQTALNLQQILVKGKQGNKVSDEKVLDLDLPSEIKRALEKLDAQIQKGDVISTRIYNGMQYELLESYQKTKMKKSHSHAAFNKAVNIRLRNKDAKREIKVKDLQQRKNFADYVLGTSLTSINHINQLNDKSIFHS